MNMKQFLLLSWILLGAWGSAEAQSPNDQQQQILVPGLKNTYQAVYLDEHGDTLSIEKIGVHFTDRPWRQDSGQMEIVCSYQGFTGDSSAFTPALHGGRLSWESEEVMGFKEYESTIWMYPFRANQYYLTEVAPFPYFVKHAVAGQTWSSKLSLGKGLGRFEGKARWTYQMVGQKHYQSDQQTIPHCYEIHSVSRHRLGKSSLNYLVHPAYGFVRLHYSFFNGHELQVSLLTSSVEALN